MKRNRKFTTSFRLLTTLCFTYVIADVGVARAQDVEPSYSLFLGTIYSDNIGRQPADGLDELVAELGGTLAIERETKRLSLKIDADGAFRRYTKDTFDDEFFGGLFGIADFQIVPQRLSWDITNHFGQVQTDLGQVQTPENRGNFNRFSTGPTLFLPMGSVNVLSLNAQYTDVYFEARNDDYDQISGRAGFQRALSSARDIALFVTASEINYDSGLPATADIQSAYFQINSRAARSTLELDIGYNTSETDFSESDSTLFRLKYSRDLSSRTVLNLMASKSIVPAGDAAIGLRGLPGSQVDDEIQISDNNQPVDLSIVGVGLDYDAGRTRFSFGGSYSKEDSLSLIQNLDRKVLSFRLSVSRELGRNATATISGSHRDDEPNTALDTIKQITCGVEFIWKVGRRVDLSVGFQRYEGDGGGSRPNFNYDENRATLRLSFVPR